MAAIIERLDKPRQDSAPARPRGRPRRSVSGIMTERMNATEKFKDSLTDAENPLKFLASVMLDEDANISDRLRAAATMIPYTHAKPAAVGKKEAEQQHAADTWADVLGK